MATDQAMSRLKRNDCAYVWRDWKTGFGSLRGNQSCDRGGLFQEKKGKDHTREDGVVAPITTPFVRGGDLGSPTGTGKGGKDCNRVREKLQMSGTS